MKEIKDYLHLHLGCDVLICINREGNRVIEKLDAEQLAEEIAVPIGIKPILRPLSSMTDEEVGEHADLFYHIDFIIGDTEKMVAQAKATQYLLSKHFDLFGLIEAGLALDATTLK